MQLFRNSWDDVLQTEIQKPYFMHMLEKLHQEYKNKNIYPPQHQVFQAFHLTPYDQVRVVILGQDPYHQPGQAHGLSFSVLPGIPLPPSLKNIFKELETDLHVSMQNRNGFLQSWARQGVFLLNTVLTVEESKPNAHKEYGWQTFTDVVIQKLAEKNAPMVFILWGANAKNKAKYIHNPLHKVICSAHPSPLSAYQGFFGSKPFSQCNAFLQQHGQEPIRWEK